MKKLLLSLILPIFCYGNTPTQKEMIHDLEVAKHLFQTKYGPLQWKKEHFGWNLEQQFLKARNQVLTGKAKNIKSFQKIFKDFLLSSHDYHVNVFTHSTAMSWFPISIKGVDGHYYLLKEASDKPPQFLLFKPCPFELDKYKEAIFSLNPGDEVLAIDGIPIRELIEELIVSRFGGNRAPSSYAMAELMLFKKAAETAETFTLTLLHQDTIIPVNYILPWIRIPEWIKSQPLDKPSELIDAAMSLESQKNEPKKLLATISKLLTQDYSIKQAYPILFGSEEMEELPKVLEDNKSADTREKGRLPPLGEVIWETDNKKTIYGYLYLNEEGQKIGYIFLKSFDHENPDLMVPEILDVIEVFEKETEALVFDITDNPGGSALYAYAVLSALTTKPLKCPTQRETLIQEDLFNYIAVQQYLNSMIESRNEESEPYTLSGLIMTEKIGEGLKKYIKNLLKTWESGKRFTKPMPLLGIAEIEPNPRVQYSKPILLLINELGFSCSDIFAAILQDSSRATLFGKQTAGAGGYVRKYKHTSRFGIAGYTLTGSIITRENGQVIENLGVTPDVPYDLTVRDMRDNYIYYIKNVNNEINKLIAGVS